jgi:hypothetical protein
MPASKSKDERASKEDSDFDTVSPKDGVKGDIILSGFIKERSSNHCNRSRAKNNPASTMATTGD